MKQIRRGAAGFTLIELLVVILILGILMAIALPLYFKSMEDAERKTCRANMQSIANAVQAYHVRYRLTAYPAAGSAVSTSFADDLQVVPVCPKNGAYTIEAAVAPSPFTVRCTGTSGGVVHGDYHYGVDNQ